MSDEKLDQLLERIDTSKRDTIRKIVIGAGFAVPTVGSFAVTDLAYGQVGSPGTTSAV